MNLLPKLLAEFFGTAFLLAVVIGSGIMGENLAAGNTAVALLANAIATGAGLYVLITALGAVSGAHFNPAVTIMFWLGERTPAAQAIAYIVVQIAGGCIGVWATHVMFELPIWQLAETVRAGPSQLISELIATTGLLGTIILVARHRVEAIAASVGLYITAAYWFTASTSFANPAVTIARMFSDTFAGIRPSDAPGFIAMQLIIAVVAGCLLRRVQSR